MNKTKQETFSLGRAGSPLAHITITANAPPPPTETERRDLFLRGAVRLRADEKAIEALRALDAELAILQEQIETKAVDHIGPAAARAGKAAYKALGRDAFPAGELEAIAWARKTLPLADAWTAAARDADERMRASRQANTVRKQFWADAESLAATVAHFSRASNDLGRMVAEVMHAGAK